MLLHFGLQHLLDGITEKIFEHVLDVMHIAWFVEGKKSLDQCSFLWRYYFGN